MENARLRNLDTMWKKILGFGPLLVFSILAFSRAILLRNLDEETRRSLRLRDKTDLIDYAVMLYLRTLACSEWTVGKQEAMLPKCPCLLKSSAVAGYRETAFRSKERCTLGALPGAAILGYEFLI